MKMKRILSVFLAYTVIGAAVPISEYSAPVMMTAQAETEAEYTEGTYGLLTYKNYGDHIEISGCDKSVTKVNIPEEIGGIPVTSIGDYAFCYCTSLLSVDIGSNVTSIDDNAFYSCTSLTSITIPDSVTSIDDFAFSYCLSLRDVNIPNGVTVLTSAAFLYCTSLKSVTVPESVSVIEDGAFWNCSELNNVTILNPDCSIGAEFNEAICNEYDDANKTLYYYGVISGYKGSTAEAYAEKLGFNFRAIDNIGDVNLDGAIDAIDASLVLTEYSALATGRESTLDDTAKYNADVNLDGAVDALDASCILSYYAHIAIGGTGSILEFI